MRHGVSGNRYNRGMRIDFSASSNLLATPGGAAGTAGTAGLKARSTAEKVIYETQQKMQSIRETLEGHGPGGFPAPGELLRLTTFADVNALTILLRAVEVFGNIDLLYLASYSINQRAVFALREMLISGAIRSAVILGSDTITWRDPARIREMHETARLLPDVVKFRMANNHAKVMAWRASIGGDLHEIVCTGSANLASNSRIEDYVMTNSAEGFRHYRDWIEAVAMPLPEAV